MNRFWNIFFALAVALGLASCGGAPGSPAGRYEGVPRYAHVFVVVEENKNYAWIMDPRIAPNIADLAKRYGDAVRFFSEVHPSEANYVALLGGDTFGIRDDDAYYCTPGSSRAFCDHASLPGYVGHTVQAPQLGDQLVRAGLSWKGYYESLPGPGSLAVTGGGPEAIDGPLQTALYASKHSGFVNFADVQSDPERAQRVVGFDQLSRDLASNDLPSFALIVPNQCDEMHGLLGAGVPADCDVRNTHGLIRRGDQVVGDLVRRVQASRAWSGPDNFAIVITFDESGDGRREGCCGITPGAASNFGGGHIPTIVITNHGPRGVKDETPYSHYSLLRTLEDAFRLPAYLGHAADTGRGVKPMTPLFRVSGRS